MARTNLNPKGSVRAEIIGGPDVQFVEGTNSGLFASITYNGLGDYTVLFARSLAPGDQVQLQIEGTDSGSGVSTRISPTREDILTFDTAANNLGAADRDFSLVVVEQFKG